MENKYAVVLKRVSSDLIRNIYIYEIDKVVKGQYFIEENIFIDENNNKILTFENDKILNKSCKKFVCSILTENELLEKYPSLSINESLSLCYMDFTKLITIVSYDYDNDEIKMISIDKINVINKVSKKSKNNDIDSSEEFYEQVKNNFGDNEFLITKNDYETLLKINDMKELLNYIKDIQNNKDLYEEKISKMKIDDDWGMVIRNDYINPIYYLDSVIKMKKYLINLKETFIDNKDENKISYVEYFSRMFSDLKEDVLSLDELDILKEFLSIQINDIKNSKKQFTFLKESGYHVDEIIELLDIYGETMNKIIRLKTVSSIHKAYEELYNKTEGIIISAGVTLDDIYNNESFKLEKDEINSQYINDLFNYSINEINNMNSIDEIKVFCMEMKYNFSAIVDTLLSKTDIEIEKDEITNIFDNIVLSYDEIINMTDIEIKEDIVKDAYEYALDEVEHLGQLYDEIISRINEDNEQLPIQERKQIIIKNIMKKIEKPYNELQELVGLEDVKLHVDKLIKEKVYELVFQNDKKNKRIKKYNYFFSGNPGTGKTTVAIILCDILAKLGCIKNNRIKKTTASDFIAGYVGQTAIKTKKLIQECKGGVIFIDEAYALASTGSNSFTQDVFGELLPVVADGDISLILAGYNEEMKEFLDSNTGIKDRINNYFEFKDYTLDELVDMFVSLVSKYDYVVSEDAKEMFKEVIKEESTKKNFGNGRVVENFTNKILDSHEANMVDYDIDDDSVITVLDIENAKLKDTVYKEKVKKLGF